MSGLPSRWVQRIDCPSCGSPMTAGTRYEADGTVDVLICWECAYETPSLYRRSQFARGSRNLFRYRVPLVRAS